MSITSTKSNKYIAIEDIPRNFLETDPDYTFLNDICLDIDKLKEFNFKNLLLTYKFMPDLDGIEDYLHEIAKQHCKFNAMIPIVSVRKIENDDEVFNNLYVFIKCNEAFRTKIKNVFDYVYKGDIYEPIIRPINPTDMNVVDKFIYDGSCSDKNFDNYNERKKFYNIVKRREHAAKKTKKLNSKYNTNENDTVISDTTYSKVSEITSHTETSNITELTKIVNNLDNSFIKFNDDNEVFKIHYKNDTKSIKLKLENKLDIDDLNDFKEEIYQKDMILKNEIREEINGELLNKEIEIRKLHGEINKLKDTINKILLSINVK